jgi:hypothetical protein
MRYKSAAAYLPLSFAIPSADAALRAFRFYPSRKFSKSQSFFSAVEMPNSKRITSLIYRPDQIFRLSNFHKKSSR